MAKTQLPISLVKSEEDMRPKEPYDLSEKRGECIWIKGENAMTLPDSGEMTVKFLVKKREEENEDGEKEYEVKLELLEIVDVSSDEPAPPASSGSETGSALDRMRGEMQKG